MHILDISIDSNIDVLPDKLSILQLLYSLGIFIRIGEIITQDKLTVLHNFKIVS